jgi:hypothetical protein
VIPVNAALWGSCKPNLLILPLLTERAVGGRILNAEPVADGMPLFGQRNRCQIEPLSTDRMFVPDGGCQLTTCDGWWWPVMTDHSCTMVRPISICVLAKGNAY